MRTRCVPELPEILAYLDALQPRIIGKRLESLRIPGPFVVRTFEPPIEEILGRRVLQTRRLGKRIVLEFDGELFLVIHLMIAGRLRWADAGGDTPKKPVASKIALATFRFESGTLTLTEAGSKKRASLHVVRSAAELSRHDPGGMDPLTCSLADFAATLRRENHTLKRSLTDPRQFSGIGNAYSDEILHAARLSPLLLTRRMSDAQVAALHGAARRTLEHWMHALRRQFAGRFPGPGEITAFRPDFVVHGRFEMACPTCGAAVQRIRYADNETNYCPRCQTGGRVLADRSLSRLLKDDWPRTLQEE
ncbi:putative formamidopyrimidine-DNA glycosylase-like protein [Phycisphaerae bacterium RAS1]|nr:putative formamidopyrimidine-DNA glycosylase-like protein [Phycisphaerae bacterium RAS1]